MRLNAVAWAHRRAGMRDPTGDELVRSVLRSASDRRTLRLCERARAVSEDALLDGLRVRRRRGRGVEQATWPRRGLTDLMMVTLARSLMLTARELAALRWCDLDLWRGRGLWWLRLADAELDAHEAALGLGKLGEPVADGLADVLVGRRDVAADERALVLGLSRSQVARRLGRAVADAERRELAGLGR